MDGFSIRLYEKRPKYTRTRMVKLSSFLTADSVDSYCADYIDAENAEAVFDVAEIEESLAFRQSIPEDLMSLLRNGLRDSAHSTLLNRHSATLLTTVVQMGWSAL